MVWQPVVFSPASPSELLSFIVNDCVSPTTLIICSPRPHFISTLVADVSLRSDRDQGEAKSDAQPEKAENPLLEAPLYQVAVSRHTRLIFVATVSHLRAVLSTFSLKDSPIPAPPAQSSVIQEGGRCPLLVVYGLLEIHRDTSEWSAQGLGSTAAGLVEAATRDTLQAVIIEPWRPDHAGYLDEAMPILSRSAHRIGQTVGDVSWTGRTVSVRQALGRWFRFQPWRWNKERSESGKSVISEGDWAIWLIKQRVIKYTRPFALRHSDN